MLENWLDNHPWMTFFLGILSLLTLNTFFVSIGGGYKKFPTTVNKQETSDEESHRLLND